MTRTQILQGCIDRIAPYRAFVCGGKVEYRKGHGFYLLVSGTSYYIGMDYLTALYWIAVMARDGRRTPIRHNMRAELDTLKRFAAESAS